MTASDLSRPEPLWGNFSRLVSGGSPIQRSRHARERSLTEMLSLADWSRFIPESVGLLVLISLARTVLPSGPAGPGSLPHPYWIPVLLMSGQYGIMSGLFATLAATAAFFISGLPAQSATQDFYAYAGIVAAQPCAWFGTALVLGGLRTLHIHHQTELQERFEQTELAAEDLADGLERAVSEVERLEHRIATDSSTLACFLHSLAKLELSDGCSLIASVADVIRYGVGATSFAIYLAGTRGLEPCLGVEDGSRVPPTAVGLLSPSLLHQIYIGITEVPPAVTGDYRAGAPYWAPICVAGAAEPVGVVVCNRLLPSQEPAIAVRRLNEVCRVLAVLLSACSAVGSGVCDDGGT
jgi:hypothetical protein